MKNYLHSLNVGFKYLEVFLSEIEFFQKNPASKQLALKTYFNETWGMYVRPIYNQIPTHDREDALREEFGGSANITLITFLLNELGTSEKRPEFTMLRFIPSPVARIEIKFTPKSADGDFQIVSVSDDKADVSKPGWFQKNGIGYKIESHVSNFEIVTKTANDGQLTLNLRGLSVVDPKDKSKRLPYWVEYANLTVNGKTLFATSKFAWHDKPYNYNMDVKADDEIKIQVEWLPHRSDT